MIKLIKLIWATSWEKVPIVFEDMQWRDLSEPSLFIHCVDERENSDKVS